MVPVEALRSGDKILLKMDNQHETSITVDEARNLATEMLQLGIEIQDIDDRVKDWRRIPMVYVLLQVERDKEKCEVACWIKDQTKHNAAIIATHCVRNEGWTITDTLELSETSVEDYDDYPDELQYYRQALLDEEVFVFYHEEDA